MVTACVYTDLNEASPEDLIVLIQTGNDDAFRILYQMFRHPLYKFAIRRTQDHHLAEDVVSETFVRLREKVDMFTRDKGSASGWIFRIALHIIIDHARKLQTRYEIPGDEFFDLLPVGGNPQYATEAEATDAAAAANLRAYIRRLSSKKRACLYLYYWRDLSAPQIAKMLNMPEGTVRSVLHYAINDLRDWASKDFIFR